jgi:hypothetical protein
VEAFVFHGVRDQPVDHVQLKRFRQQRGQALFIFQVAKESEPCPDGGEAYRNRLGTPVEIGS